MNLRSPREGTPSRLRDGPVAGPRGKLAASDLWALAFAGASGRG